MRLLIILGSLIFGMERVMAADYTYDDNGVRYEHYQVSKGKNLNWVFLPGGPGADSSYYRGLVDLLHLEGNVWLVDMPGIGSNVDNDFGDNFDRYFEIFPKIIDRYENVVLVGQSFGGMFPLCFPELEEKLLGFVCLNSAPCLWMEEAVAYGKKFDLPDLSVDMGAFNTNPCDETFMKALDACMYYYAANGKQELYRKNLKDIPFTWKPAVWWQHKAVEMNFSAKWVPQKVQTLILCGKYDAICPYTLFEKDERFKRDNITMVISEEGGHLTWIDDPECVVEAFRNFIKRLYDSSFSHH